MTREEVLIESARKIVEQGGDCTDPMDVPCNECPAFRPALNDPFCDDGRWESLDGCLAWFRAYISEHAPAEAEGASK